MGVTATNLIQGPAVIYAGVFGVTEPTPFISGAPAVGLVDLGGTSDGVTLMVENEYSDLKVDQIVDVVGRRRVGRSIKVGTNLAEATLDNFARAIGNSAPVSNVLELDNDLTVFQPNYGAILLEGIAPGGFKRRIMLRKTLPTGSVEMAYKKDGMTLIPVEWSLQWVSTSIKAFKMEDATV